MHKEGSFFSFFCVSHDVQTSFILTISGPTSALKAERHFADCGGRRGTGTFRHRVPSQMGGGDCDVCKSH
jgi:hypothetical protein